MRLISIFFVVALLGGCSARKEIPVNPSGIDEMRGSPCACTQLDYQGENFKWIS